ncbi:MAG: hypothetical protein M0Z38_00535 [Deltaproteobacteria bacterium]|nr:hypothetical protein [Deltaproteobacteria bacterium]
MKACAVSILVAVVILSLFAATVAAEERIVVGRISRLELATRTFSVTDGMGTGWNFKVDEGSGIELSTLEVGDRVEVRIARATPLNMISAADVLRKGDSVTLSGGY